MGKNLIRKIGKSLVVPGLISCMILSPNIFRKEYSFEDSIVLQKPSVINYIVEKTGNDVLKYSLGLGSFPEDGPSKIVVNGKSIKQNDSNYKSLRDRYFLIRDEISNQQ